MHESLRPKRSDSVRMSLSAAAVLAAAGLAVLPALGQQNPVEKAPPPPATLPQSPPPAPPKEPQAPQPVTLEMLDSHVFDITGFVFRYGAEHPDMPAVDQLGPLQVTLGVKDGVLVAARPGLQAVTLTLAELTSARGVRKFSASGVNAVALRVVDFFNQRGLVGVAVIPAPGQIDLATLEDKRPADKRTLVMDIWVRTVKEVRTLGAGPRWSKPTAEDNRPSLETRINHPFHQRIRDNSPVGDGDLLRRREIEDYVAQLERLPGRRVDATVAAGANPGEVALDYVITENRPWSLYAQVSNTGTENTSNWRERIGFVDTQLTNRDDILAIDYVTASFDQVNAITLSYEAPFFNSPTTRWKVYGSASEFTASDVGFPGENFKGDSAQAGAELSTNVLQVKRSFLDVFGGFRFEYVHVENTAAALIGRDNFFIPYVGARFERAIFKATTLADVRFEANLPEVAGTESDLNALGRLGADREWTALKWNVSHSVYLEPLIFSRDWANPDATFHHTTLAHELYLSFRGQEAFGNRLIPQEEETAGGLYTVRGYKESAFAGDSVQLFTGEYRFHLPRAMSPGAPGNFFGSPFRWRPEQRYSQPDWDLILRAFVDLGHVQADGQPSHSLVGAGVGAEVTVLRNFSLRVDLGMAMKSAGSTESGDNRIHIVGTILY